MALIQPQGKIQLFNALKLDSTINYLDDSIDSNNKQQHRKIFRNNAPSLH